MQLPDEVRKSAAFLGYESIKAGKFRLGGTAFFVSIRETDGSGINTTYAVTAKHVIDGIRNDTKDQQVIIRVNYLTAEIEKGFLKTRVVHAERGIDCDLWTTHPSDDLVDVAVIPLDINGWMADQVALGTKNFATKELIKEHKIGVGNDVFIVGLFRIHTGFEKNIPIVRVGNIAAMPEEKVNSKIGMIEAYLIEARSIGGLSGSPVYAVKESSNDESKLRFALLGLIHGHFILPKTGEDAVVDDMEPDTENLNRSINVGIAMVVPAYQILEVLNHPDLVKARDAAKKEHWRERAGVPDAVD